MSQDARKRLKQVTPEQFLKYHSQYAQDVATQTGQATDLYRDNEGRPMCTLEGWPRDGVKVATFQPQVDAKRRYRQAPVQVVAEAKPAVAKAGA